MNDILLDNDDDLLVLDGDLVLGDTLTQDVGIILRLNQGDLKSDPLLGPGLIRMINGSANPIGLQKLVRLHLARDGKNYDNIKHLITMKTNGSN